MAFNSLKFLEEWKIPHSTEHHHARKGWIALRVCPYCGSTNYHFGMNESSGGCSCFKCGKHGLLDTIQRLCKANYSLAKSIQGRYTDRETLNPLPNAIRRDDGLPTPISLPLGSDRLKTAHREYLRSRNFDDRLLEREWGLKGVGVIPGSLFSMRIIIPITYKGIICSYQGRDITGRADRIRYRTCAKRDESRFHKHCLYGLDKVKGDSLIVTEGVTKVWRLGIGAVATFGIVWTMPQAAMLLDYKRVFVLYDEGEQAQFLATKLANLVGDGTEVIHLEGIADPGDLEQEDADYLMKELNIRR